MMGSMSFSLSIMAFMFFLLMFLVSNHHAVLIKHKYVTASRSEITSEIVAKDTFRAKKRNGTRECIFPEPISGVYVMEVRFGTPATNFLMSIDTGSELVWVQCVNPNNDVKHALFHPNGSSSYRPVKCGDIRCKELREYGGATAGCSDCNKHCTYKVGYKDGSFSNGTLSLETVTIETSEVNFKMESVVFGCSHFSKGFESDQVFVGGLVGMGRSGFALPSQASNSFKKKFAYCLPRLSNSSSKGFIDFGDDVLKVGGAGYQTTPLLSINDQFYSSFYFVTLRSIVVNKVIIEMSNGGHLGSVLDSGTTISLLQASKYNALKRAFVKETRRSNPGLLPTVAVSIFDTCYSNVSSSYIFPSLSFYFDGMTNPIILTEANVLFEAVDGVFCLGFAPLEAGFNASAILGSHQQEGIAIVHDIPASKIGFLPSACH